MAQGTPVGCTSRYQESFTVGQEFNPYKRFRVNCTPEEISRYRGLSQGAKNTYGRLARFAGEDGNAFPAVGTLAAEIGVSINQARRYLQELAAKKFIEIVANAGRQNYYKFLWHAAFEGTIREEATPAPLPDVGGVKAIPISDNLPPEKKGIPLPSVIGVPLPSVVGLPLPSLGDEESQSKESQKKRVSLFASACVVIRNAVYHATEETINDDRLTYAILDHGCSNDLPPAALARCIEWLVYDRKTQGYRARAGLALNIVREESVAWARENGSLVHRLQMEARESGWSPEAMKKEAGPQLALGAAFKIPSSSEKLSPSRNRNRTA